MLREEIFSSMGLAARDVWEASKDAYVAYLAEHDGDTPPSTGTCGWLGRWMCTQRSNQSTMSAEHRRALIQIGFWWTAAEATWEREFARLSRSRGTSRRTARCRPRART
jgi:hypothetical protein